MFPDLTNRSRATLARRKERKIPAKLENMELAELSTMHVEMYENESMGYKINTPFSGLLV